MHGVLLGIISILRKKAFVSSWRDWLCKGSNAEMFCIRRLNRRDFSKSIRKNSLSLITGMIVLVLCIAASTFLAASRRGSLGPRTNAATEAGTLNRPFVPKIYPLKGYVIDGEFRTHLHQQCINSSTGSGIAFPAIAKHAIRLKTLMIDDRSPNRTLANSETLQFFDTVQNCLLDDREYKKWGFSLPLLFETPHGACFRTRARNDKPTALDDRIGGMTHVDAILAALAEADVPLSTPIYPSSGKELTLLDVLEDSLKRVTRDRQQEREIEWTVVACTRYLQSQPRWLGAHGDPVELDDLARLLVEMDPMASACLGTHRLYAMANLFARNSAEPGYLRDGTCEAVSNQLAEVVRRLEAHQLEDGSWNEAWFSAANPLENKDKPRSTTELEDKLRVTGHMLEWMTMVPPKSRTSPQCMRKAVVWLESMFRLQGELCFDKHLLPSTHAVRALCLLSEKETP